MAEHEATMEGKLNGLVYKGDIIFLHSIYIKERTLSGVDIAGFLLDYDSTLITLCHEDPFIEKGYAARESVNIRNSNFRGDKTYRLNSFDSFKVLRDYSSRDEKVIKDSSKKTETDIAGKLNGHVHKGDVIFLHSNKLDVAGFVSNFDSHLIKISHEDPFAIKPGHDSAWGRNIRKSWGRGDKIYILNKFESFKVLREYSPQKGEE